MPVKDPVWEVSWGGYEFFVKELFLQLKGNKFEHNGVKIQSIHGIPRGGLIVAVMLSHMCELPITDLYSRSTLIVDDITDKGVTLQPYNTYPTATLFKRSTSTFTPWVFALEIQQHCHVKFPYETDISTFTGRGGL